MATPPVLPVNNRRDRVRFTGRLCMHCVRNLAFHHAIGRRLRGMDRAWEHEHQFWVNTVNNCLDIAVLEWCKLFGRWSEEHHWRKIVSKNRQERFKTGLLARMRMTDQKFQKAQNNMLEYRDQFLAHLDTRPSIQLPHTLFALRGTVYLYHELLADPDNAGFLPDAQPSAVTFYKFMYRQGQQEWRRRFPR
jgi:hypothetical protein